MFDDLSWNARTSLLVHEAMGASIEDRGDYLVVRSPDNPLYHWGNFVHVLRGDPSDAAGWLAVFEREFPGVRHRALSLNGEPDPAPWAAAGVGIEKEVTLLSDGMLPPVGEPAGYVFRVLDGDDDWAGVAALSRTDGPADDARFGQFCADMAAADRRLCEARRAGWFGAFERKSGVLAASLGVVLLEDGLVSYEKVITDPAYRRRGLAHYLLRVGSEWAWDHGARRLVIVTDADSDPAHLYQNAGFTPVEYDFSAYAPAGPVR